MLEFSHVVSKAVLSQVGQEVNPSRQNHGNAALNTSYHQQSHADQQQYNNVLGERTVMHVRSEGVMCTVNKATVGLQA